MTTYVDANLLHDYITGRSCTGIIHLFNKTVMDWFSKLQSNVETATYGSEFTVLRTAVDQIHDLRYSARALGVPIIGPIYLFGDNLSTIISSTKSDGKIAKRWNILSFHRVREAVAHGIVRPFHIDGKDNPADVLSKHTSSSVWYELMRPLIFWRNNDTVSDECEIEGSISESNSQVINLSKSDSDIIRVNCTYILAGTDFSMKTNNADADAAAESFRVRFV
ncbi:gag-pol polyprotein [Chaetoceros tenuissimus]|uniref:Gag-pol polyprotein n=1 Tax=Chaetoceros tenuissimus TaxID=426638 RepID=A0AAD3H9X4_9STRA|nr:gag-pol polyprotein [Chaetoceros tenuissimus]